MDYTSLIKELNIPELVNALRICSGFVENPSCSECDYSLSVKCRRDMMHDAAAAIEALQAEVKDLKKVNMELFEDLPKYVKDELPKEKGWYYLVYLSKWNGKEWWVPPFPDYWTKPPQEEL